MNEQDTRAYNAPISEKPAPSLKESTEDTQVLTDSREHLLDYIWREITTTLRNNGRLHDPNFWYANIVSWLDRQAAITTAECTAEDESCCEACRAAQKRKLAELAVEVDNLRKRNDSQAGTIRRLRAEFDAALDDLARAVEDKRSHPF